MNLKYIWHMTVATQRKPLLKRKFWNRRFEMIWNIRSVRNRLGGNVRLMIVGWVWPEREFGENLSHNFVQSSYCSKMMKTFFLCIMFNHILFIKHYDKIRIGPHRLLAMFSPSCERPWVASLWRGELSQDSQVRTNKLAKIRNQIRKKQIAKYLAAKNSLLNFGLCNFWDMSCHSHTMILKFEKSDANSQDCKIRSDWRDLIANTSLPK